MAEQGESSPIGPVRSATLALFPTVVRVFEIPDLLVDRAAMADEIRSLRAGDGSIDRTGPSPHFEWMSGTDLQVLPPFRRLIEVALDLGREALHEAGWVFDDLAVTECWANASDPSAEGHREHAHPNSLLSGTFYVAVPPGSGALTLADPRPAPMILLDRSDRNIENTRSVDLEVAEGMLVLFPSFLRHSVGPNRNGGLTRLSVAWNCMPTGWVGPPTARFHLPGQDT